MFCPNCGTQNPETVQACSKCGFHLKSVAAPKFKGTMLMMNQPSSTPPPPSSRRSSSVPPPGALTQRAGSTPAPGSPASRAAIASKLKGTMMGVAPMAGPVRGPSPVAVPPAGTPGLVEPPAPAPAGGAETGSAFLPPVPQPGVNPLGGTVAAYGPPAGAAAPYGTALPGRGLTGTQLMPSAGGSVPPAPMPGAGPLPSATALYGPPGGAVPTPSPPAYGSPAANAYGSPAANAYGSPPTYGAPAPQGGFAFGRPSSAPPPQGPAQSSSAAPPGLTRLSGAPGPIVPHGGESRASSVRPQGSESRQRSPLLTWLLPLVVIFGGVMLGAVLALVAPALGLLGAIVALAGAAWWLLLAIGMVKELKAVTRSEAFAWWPLFVPFYGLYWAWVLVPREVAKAKQMRGVQRPVQPIGFYVFLWHFALASDLNEIAP